MRMVTPPLFQVLLRDIRQVATEATATSLFLTPKSESLSSLLEMLKEDNRHSFYLYINNVIQNEFPYSTVFWSEKSFSLHNFTSLRKYTFGAGEGVER